MAGDRDAILLETVKTHRARLVSALIFGELDERRLVVSNIRRFVIGLVLAAVACAGCAGTSFVISVLDDQANAQRAKVGAVSTPSPTSPGTPRPKPSTETP